MTIELVGGPCDGQTLRHPERFLLDIENGALRTRIAKSWHGVWHAYEVTAEDRTRAIYIGPETKEWGKA